MFPEMHAALYGVARQLARGAGSISPGSLINEAYLRLRKSEKAKFQDEIHFKRLAARAMRFVLLDHLRERTRYVTLLDSAGKSSDVGGTLFDLQRALTAFEKVDPRRAELVNLKCFGGLANKEIAAQLGVSVATVKLDWKFARAWMHHWLSNNPHRE